MTTPGRIVSAGLFFVVCFTLSVDSLRAQNVPIPDTYFRNWLVNNGFAGCINASDMLDINCPEVLNATKIDCSNSNIAKLTGIQYFVNLDTLICANNVLFGLLATLPPGLKYLDCNNNDLAGYPALPSTLKYWDCSFAGMDITVYLPPALPAGLEYLNCSNNGIMPFSLSSTSLTHLLCTQCNINSLPALPSTLKYLYCPINDLTTLPSLPAGLDTLICNQNDLYNLPALPDSLKYLNCQNNDLTGLPPLPQGLKTVICSVNSIDSLPDLPAGLQYLDCYLNDPLTALPALPDSLTYLEISNCSVSSLPTLPDKLTRLYADYNELSVIPPLPDSLVTLDITDNQVLALPPLPGSLKRLYAGNNQLAFISALPPSMSVLRLYGNPALQCLPPLLEYTGSATGFSIAGTGIQCLPNVIQHTGYIAAIDTMPLCDITGGCSVTSNITGTVFHDSDSNCVQGSEPGLKNIKISVFDADTISEQVITNTSGHYAFQTFLDTSVIRIDTSGLPFYIACLDDTAHHAFLSGISSDTLADFAVACKQGYDLSVISIVRQSGLFFPGQNAFVRINASDLAGHYGTHCNTTGLSGSVMATVSGPGSLVSATAGGIINGNSVTWQVNDFAAVEDGDFEIQLSIPATAQSGQLSCVFAQIVSGTGGSDNNVVNDTLQHCFEVVNSFDPNVKEVHPALVTTPGDWHTYTVHFQNTGTAPALNIIVKDTLDSKLDWNSFQLLASSHDNSTQIKSNGIVHFNFPNIQLPDSTSNEPESHGYVQYKIKTKSDIQPGTSIHNTAAIYFDFNEPVITNDAVVNYCFPNNFALTQNGATLTSTMNADSYQWINCDNNQPITGATNPVFTATSNGNYAVELTYGNGCVTRSSCVDVTSIGITSVHQAVLNVYPNPSQGSVQFDLRNHQGVLTIYDTLGQIITQANVGKATATLNDLPQGLLSYTFIAVNGSVYTGKITVQK